MLEGAIRCVNNCNWQIAINHGLLGVLITRLSMWKFISLLFIETLHKLIVNEIAVKVEESNFKYWIRAITFTRIPFIWIKNFSFTFNYYCSLGGKKEKRERNSFADIYVISYLRDNRVIGCNFSKFPLFVPFFLHFINSSSWGHLAGDGGETVCWRRGWKWSTLP